VNLQFTRASTVWPFVRFLNEIGAPTDRLLSLARIPPDLLEDAEALVPLPLAYRFLELAAGREGGTRLATAVASRTSAFDLGAFGAALRRAPTIGEYIGAAIRGIGTTTSGERFSLTTEGPDLRLWQSLPGPPGIGRALADTYTMALTVNMLRRAAGEDWHPREVSLVEKYEAVRGEPFHGAARVTTGTPCSSIIIERALLDMPMNGRASAAAARSITSSVASPSMPDGFVDRLEQLIRALLPGGYPDISYVAEMTDMSPRTLQRRLAGLGLTYAGMVMRCRLSMAEAWLSRSDMKVTDIAARLGYGDASNFSRAFRAQMGMSPQAFRSRTRTAGADAAGVRDAPSP
jgi:AraC-like DNA-binding protein